MFGGMDPAMLQAMMGGPGAGGAAGPGAAGANPYAGLFGAGGPGAAGFGGAAAADTRPPAEKYAT